MAWGFSFHIIPLADPKFFFFFLLLTHSNLEQQQRETQSEREGERELLPYSRYWDGKRSQDRMCLPKPKENKQMACVFIHWTPTVLTISTVCVRRTAAYNSFVVRDANFRSKLLAKISHRHTCRCSAMFLSPAGIYPSPSFLFFFPTTISDLLCHVFVTQRPGQDYSQPTSPQHFRVRHTLIRAWKYGWESSLHL